MSEEEPKKKLRGTPVYVPPWWLDMVRRRWDVLHDELGWSYQQLADALTDLVERTLNGERFPWDRKTVERFIDDEVTTLELVEAFCDFFDLITPVYVAHSPDEAMTLYRASEPYRPREDAKAASIKRERRDELLAERAEIEQRLKERNSGQTRSINSINDGPEVDTRGVDRRKHGRVGRRRSSPS